MLVVLIPLLTGTSSQEKKIEPFDPTLCPLQGMIFFSDLCLTYK